MERRSAEPVSRVLVFDVAPAVAFLVLGLWDVVAELSAPFGDGSRFSPVVPVIVACLALLWRRRRPMTALAVIWAALLLPGFVVPVRLTFFGEYVVWLVAQYSVGRHAPWRRGWLALPVSYLVYGVALMRYPNMRETDTTLVNLAVLAVVWLVGRLSASWTEYRARALRLELERARTEERAAGRERARIAREVHDVVSHTIAVVAMQAGGARLAAREDPEAAARALGTIEELARNALGELRALLEVLSVGGADDAAGTAPQPRLTDLEDLCARMRALGLQVRLRVGGSVDDLPDAVQLTGYRVVQEGLTNVVKHAGAVSTEVVVEREVARGTLAVEVISAAGDPTLALPGAERGLAGLQDRVSAFGGTLTTGDLADGGFVLRATLPASLPVP